MDNYKTCATCKRRYPNYDDCAPSEHCQSCRIENILTTLIDGLLDGPPEEPEEEPKPRKRRKVRRKKRDE